MSTHDGRRYVVTGATRGIGRGIAERLLSESADVIGTYHERAAEAASMEARFAGRIRMLQVDFSDRQSTNALVARLLPLGPYDGLVNNAGIVEFETWADFTIETWDRVLEVNLNAPLILAQALARSAMAPGSAIVNIASTDGYTGSFGSIAYSASKAALLNLTKSLGNVLGVNGVRVNAVAPGWINTEMSTGTSLDAVRLTPLGRNGTPADVATVTSFLLSTDATFINGACLVVDGGYTNVDSIMKRENDDLLEGAD